MGMGVGRDPGAPPFFQAASVRSAACGVGSRFFHQDTVNSGHLLPYESGMQIGLRQFDARTVQWLIGAAEASDASRSSLARGLCARLDRRDSSEDLATASGNRPFWDVAQGWC